VMLVVQVVSGVMMWWKRKNRSLRGARVRAT
jgi:uncharacterized iron-regulated membrane protein